MRRAISRSASRSTNRWQTPLKCFRTGIRASRVTVLISSSPPRGMTKSIPDDWRRSSAPASIASARPCNARSLAAVGTAARSAAAARAAATTAAIARGSVITPGSAPVPPEDDQVVPVHRFLPGHPHALPDSCLAALYDESPQLATAVPHQSDRHLLPTAVGEHHQVAHIELPLDVHDACRQQAASLLEQGRPRPVIDDEVAAGSGGECQPALARPQGLA